MAKGTLYLIPTIIAPHTQQDVLSPMIRTQISSIDHYLVEDVRTARRFISSLKVKPVAELSFSLLNKHTDPSSLSKLMQPLLSGNDLGVLSEAGCPGVADPGHLAVSWAHREGIKVVPLVGPSSIILALMASGFNGQNFEFHGYLPIESNPRKHKIKQLEAESAKSGKAQIFMETPYRNDAMFQALLSSCSPSTQISIACSLTAPDQWISTKSIRAWKESPVPDLRKKPCIFLLQVGLEI